MLSLISFAELLLLNQARKQYLSENDYGAVDLEKVMNQVFGTDRSSWDAEEWRKHWIALEVYEEENRDTLNIRDPPQVCPYFV